MISYKFNNVTFTASKDPIGSRFEGQYKGQNVVWVSNDQTLYDDIAGDNIRRKKAAGRVIYEHLKKSYYV